MPAASILIKPASANCNMDCVYCFYKVLSSNREEYDRGFMSGNTLKALVKNAIDYADGYLSFAFQGGEPTLAGLDFYRKVVELQKRYNTKNLTIENTIQTNGVMIDTEWAKFLARNHFLVGLSLDGPRKIHDRYRMDYQGRGTYEKAMQAISLFREYGVDFNILSVITEDVTDKASYLYKFYKRNQFRFVQLIPCMDEEGRFEQCAGRRKEPVQAKSYGKFLCELFDLWYEDFKTGDFIDIRMFSNLAQMAVGYPAEECGMNGRCNCYFVVEGDGSVYPCDFYCTDEWKLGTVKDSFQELYASKKAETFMRDSVAKCKECQECPHFFLCRGGCRRFREQDGRTDGRNGLCDGYRLFFEHTTDRIRLLLSH